MMFWTAGNSNASLTTKFVEMKLMNFIKMSSCINELQNQPTRGVLIKKCSEDMHCNFIETTLRNGRFPVHLLYIFRGPSLKNTSGWLILELFVLSLKFL